MSSIPLPVPQVRESVVSPRTFAAVQELLWHDCFPVRGSSARHLCGGTNGDLLLVDLRHMLRLPGLLQPEPPSLWQAAGYPFLGRRHSNTQRQFWLTILCKSRLLSLGPRVHKVLFTPSDRLRQVWGLILNAAALLLLSCWGFSFALGHRVCFLVGSNLLLLMVVQQLVEILVFSQEKMWVIAYNGVFYIYIYIQLISHYKQWRAEGNVMAFFQCWKKKKIHQNFNIWQNYPWKVRKKTFPKKQKLKDFIVASPSHSGWNDFYST